MTLIGAVMFYMVAGVIAFSVLALTYVGILVVIHLTRRR